MKTPAWRRVHRLMLVSGALPSVIALVLIWYYPQIATESPALRWTLTVLVVMTWLGLGALVRERLVDRLRTFGNLVGALREHDYSLRASGAAPDDPLGEIALELNALADELRDRQVLGRESEALLQKVLAEVDTAMFAFDEPRHLRLVNEAGARLLGRTAAELIGVSARALGLATLLEGETPRIEEMSLPGRTARCEVRRTVFRQEGRPHRLLVVNDLSRALAAEERLAWKRLIQVLRHEINNSLAPVHSVVTTLQDKMARRPRPDDWEESVVEGLEVIRSRAESLTRMTAAYAKLTRLPPPTFKTMNLRESVQRIATLERRLPLEIVGGPNVVLRADPDQIEQVLINLVSNAVDAALETGGGVRLRWEHKGGDRDELDLFIEDDGPGLVGSENLFVPFFTTKTGGSGIGLVLSRQIVEAHGGRLTIGSRPDADGCRASLRLPVDGPRE